MTNIIIGDIAEGQRWYGQVEFMKQQLVNTYRSNNAFMSTWKQLSPDVKVFIKMVAGKPQAFIFVSGYELICAVGNPNIFAAEWGPQAVFSKDGEDWIPVFLPDIVPPLTFSGWAVQPAFNGNVIVALKYNSSKGIVSYDRGFLWQEITLPVVAYWSKIIWNGSVFCAISTEDSTTPSVVAYSMTSPDGINWTTGLLPSNGASSPTTSSWNRLAWNGEVFCTIAQKGAGPARVATSVDGLNWVAAGAIDNRFWSGLEWNGEVFCAVSNNDPGFTYINDKATISVDGVTWDLVDIPTTVDSWNDIRWNGKVFCAVATNQIIPGIIRTMVSADAINWTLSTDGSLSALNWSEIGWSGKRFYAVTSIGVMATYTAVSLDGLNWSEFDINPCGVLGGVTSVPIGVQLLPPTQV